MRRYLLLLALACGGTVEQPSPYPELEPIEADEREPEPFDACKAQLLPDPELRDATRAAAEAWNRATGCSLTLGYTGVPVHLVDQIMSPEGAEMCGHTSRRRDGATVVGVSLIEVSRSCAVWQSSVRRELAHLLGATATALAPLLPEEDAGLALIDAATLSAVCESVPCTRFEPEVE